MLKDLLLGLVAEQVGDKIQQEVKAGLSPVAPYLRKLGVGILLLLVSIIGWFGGLLFLLVALFLYLGHQGSLVVPAIWTGVISLIVGALLVIFGLRKLRRPR